MPTYEYACDSCGHEFEKEQRISEAPVKECPSCGLDQARRQISQGNFILKGGGWYSDLYAGSGNKKAKIGESASETTGSGSDSKSDSKPSSDSTKSDSKPSSDSTKSDSKPSSDSKSTKAEAKAA